MGIGTRSKYFPLSVMILLLQYRSNCFNLKGETLFVIFISGELDASDNIVNSKKFF